MAAWVRSDRPSMARILETWLLTVSSVTLSALTIVIGGIAGLYPAVRAARLSPPRPCAPSSRACPRGGQVPYGHALR